MSTRVYRWGLLVAFLAGGGLVCRATGISPLVPPAPTVGLRTLFPDLWPLLIIAAVTLTGGGWLFRHRIE